MKEVFKDNKEVWHFDNYEDAINHLNERMEFRTNNLKAQTKNLDIRLTFGGLGVMCCAGALIFLKKYVDARFKAIKDANDAKIECLRQEIEKMENKETKEG